MSSMQVLQSWSQVKPKQYTKAKTMAHFYHPSCCWWWSRALLQEKLSRLSRLTPLTWRATTCLLRALLSWQMWQAHNLNGTSGPVWCPVGVGTSMELGKNISSLCVSCFLISTIVRLKEIKRLRNQPQYSHLLDPWYFIKCQLKHLPLWWFLAQSTLVLWLLEDAKMWKIASFISSSRTLLFPFPWVSSQ